MRLSRPFPPLLPALLFMGFAGGSWAQPLPPACTQARAGQRTCMAEQACECRYERGGTMLSQPGGWRWSCSILTTCEALTPAAPPPRGLPEGTTYAPTQGGSSQANSGQVNSGQVNSGQASSGRGNASGLGSGEGTKRPPGGRATPAAKSWATPYGGQGRTGLRTYGGQLP